MGDIRISFGGALSPFVKAFGLLFKSGRKSVPAKNSSQKKAV
jgi:hypothetical protein